MLARIRRALTPRIPPEHRLARVNLARRVLIVLYGLLGLWILGDLLVALPAGVLKDRILYFDVTAIVGLAAAGWLVSVLIRRGSVVIAGYIIAGTLLLASMAATVFIPAYVQQAIFGYLFAIVTVGAIVGGASVYPFAALAILATIVDALAGFTEPLTAQTFAAALFRSIVILGVAVLLDLLSRDREESIEALHRQAEELARLARTDPLTGLANRRFFMEQLEREFQRARRYRRPLSLIYLDLDGFKAINDRFGHMFGDEILRGAARSMRAVLRSTDLLARIGGDEFAVLLPETGEVGAKDVAAKLGRALAAYGEHLGPAIPPLSFCAGISELRPSDETIDDLLNRADEAQYEAKGAGKAQTRVAEAPESPPPSA